MQFITTGLLLGFLLFFFGCNYFSTLIMSAFWADCMREAHFTTIAALNQIVGFQCVMGAATIAAALRKFPFWLRNH
jgi:ABC-type arginine/histidine transport system permease subunit